MRVQFALISVAALLAACSNADDKASSPERSADTAAPAAMSLAAPAPGLWQQTLSGGAMPGEMTVKMCLGETTPGSNPFNAQQPSGVSCTENSSRPVAGGMTFRSVCDAQGMTVTSEGRVTGDLRTAYRVNIDTTNTGPNVPPQMARLSMVIDARRLGDCPAGVAPGAVVP